MARLITVALRLLIWLLLSADITLINFLIGLLVAMLLQMGRRSRPLPPQQLLASLFSSLAAIPQAYIEAMQLLLGGKALEERLESQRFIGPRSALLVFLEVFRVTITPLTIALGIEPEGRAFRVHRLAPPPAPRQGLPGGER